nr:hypothetical protein [Tanacetum cinerariifolium]
MQTQTSNPLHNAIMEAGSKDRPQMLAPAPLTVPPTLSSQKAPIDKVPVLLVHHQHVFLCFSARDGVQSRLVCIFASITTNNQRFVSGWNTNDLFITTMTAANQDNSPRINRSDGYENQRIGNVAGARETVGSMTVQKFRIQCYNCKEFGHVARECQKPKRAKDVAYHREKMLLCMQEEAGIQLNAEQADWRDDTDDDELEDHELEAHYIEHPEQSEYVHDTYPVDQDAHNVIIDSLDMSYDREEIDQNDYDNDLDNELSCLLL